MRSKKWKRKQWIIATSSLVVAILGVSSYFLWPETPTEDISIAEAIAPRIPYDQEYPFVVGRGETLSTVLGKQKISPQIADQIYRAAKPVFDFKRMRPGTRFKLVYANTDLLAVQFRMSPIDIIEVKNVNGVWIASNVDVHVETRLVTYRGVVEGTLWESADAVKMDPNLILELAEIFAWQVDFAREVRKGDRWRISVEQKYVNGEPYGWGSILAAEYVNQGESYSAVLFKADDKVAGYFAADGSSLRRMFLKSPINYRRISSRFTKRRFHPILQTLRAHNGVDYAAPRGTPVRSVGSGTVTFAGFRGGGGNTIKVRHNSIYETAYKHLDGYAKGIRPGVRVEQGQVIGYVGTTGMSTAPHLHFEFYQSGRFVDPLGKSFPSADPVPPQYLSQFKSEAAARLDLLPPWDPVEITQAQPTQIPEDPVLPIDASTNN